MLNISITQGGNLLNSTMNFEFTNVRKTRNIYGKIANTIAHEILRKARTYKKFGSKLFDSKEPVLCKITYRGEVIDLCNYDAELVNKMRFQISDKGAERYARRLYSAIVDITHTPELQDANLYNLED